MLGSKALRLATNRGLVRPINHVIARGISTVENGAVEENDIVIVGGGPAGLALAAALGSSVRFSLPGGAEYTL